MKRWVPLIFAGCASGAIDGRDFTDATAAVDDPSCEVGLSVGDCPPDFSLERVGGGSVHLSDHIGQRIIVIGTSNW